ISKVRDGAKVSKKYDRATTPHRRAERHDEVGVEDTAILADTYATLNPAAIQRGIQSLTTELLTLTTSKAGPARRAPVTRASVHESTNQTSRAS
ncbi:MAG: integrase, partial [Rhodococcus sp. (in: high G+C Gram-positive bacteria)]